MALNLRCRREGARTQSGLINVQRSDGVADKVLLDGLYASMDRFAGEEEETVGGDVL